MTGLTASIDGMTFDVPPDADLDGAMLLVRDAAFRRSATSALVFSPSGETLWSMTVSAG